MNHQCHFSLFYKIKTKNKMCSGVPYSSHNMIKNSGHCSFTFFFLCPLSIKQKNKKKHDECWSYRLQTYNELSITQSTMYFEPQ